MIMKGLLLVCGLEESEIQLIEKFNRVRSFANFCMDLFFETQIPTKSSISDMCKLSMVREN
jgi:hypothetical protein